MITPADTPDFWGYVATKLEVIAGFQAQDKESERFTVAQPIIERIEQVLRLICTDTMVFPYINPDGDNGVCAVWRADTHALEVVVDTDLEVWTTMVHPAYPEPVVRQLYESDIELTTDLQKHLMQLSHKVQHVNPDWLKTILG